MQLIPTPCKGWPGFRLSIVLARNNVSQRTGLLLAVLLCLLSGCSSTYTIVPPPTPNDSATVFLLDVGRHASLVLPREEILVRYDYGDWEWYAKVNQGAVQGSRALFGPSPAALGRQFLKGPPTEASVRHQLGWSLEALFAIESETSKVRDLAERLDAIFHNNLQTKHINEMSNQEFVRHPKAYTMRHNSNSVVAGWLEELGCTVTGGGLISRWRLSGQQ